MWWSDWYTRATGAVSASIAAAQSSVASLFKEPPLGSGVYVPDDPPLSDHLRDRMTGTPNDLFFIEPGPLPVSTDIGQLIATRPRTWDEMSWWEKAKTYVGIVPGAVADTAGMGRETAETPVTFARSAGETVAKTAESVTETAGSLVGGTVSAALGLGPGGVGGFLSSTLVKVILGLVVIVVGLFFVMRIQARFQTGR